jgi:3D (Asp-Asp-Asp) domain-containing protein
MQMAVSAYSPKKKRNGSITATGTKPIPGCTVAVSQDNKHLLGKKIFIHGIGERLVTDLMDVRWKNKVDVCVSSKKEARLFGVKARVSVFVL